MLHRFLSLGLLVPAVSNPHLSCNQYFIRTFWYGYFEIYIGVTCRQCWRYISDVRFFTYVRVLVRAKYNECFTFVFLNPLKSCWSSFSSDSSACLTPAIIPVYDLHLELLLQRAKAGETVWLLRLSALIRVLILVPHLKGRVGTGYWSGSLGSPRFSRATSCPSNPSTTTAVCL